jgi:glycosyltransferase involved in cell wall biosynthesis
MLAITLLKQKKIPFILSTDGGFIAQESRIKYLIKRHFIGAANYWLSTGAAATDYLVHYGADREKIYIYPFTSLTENDLADGRRIGKLDKELLKEELGIRENKMVLAVGQFIYRKGMDILLRALPKMQKDFVIYIIGGTATEEYWSLLNEDDKQRVHFLNFMAKEELARYYRAADVFVLPTREDIWGLVINEALSYLVPCITTEKCGAGLALIEPGKNGMIIPVDDVDELTSAITEVSTWEGNQTKLNCLASIKEYSIENMAKRHYEVFQKMQ